jgi:putative transcriptional regulator
MKKSKILKEIHEMTSEMHKAGVINEITMRKFDALCLPTVHELKPKDIKKIREKAHVSQAVFAAYLNTSVSTVQKWEIGEKKPSGIALKILNLIEAKGLEILA